MSQEKPFPLTATDFMRLCHLAIRRSVAQPVGLLAVGAALFVSGCILPLPGNQVPAARSQWKMDPRELVAKGGPVNSGATRAHVHAAIGVPSDYFGNSDPPAVEEYYFCNRAGSFFFLGPNPEGGLIGINKRFINYTLKIAYGTGDVVSATELTSYEAFDSHEAASGEYK